MSDIEHRKLSCCGIPIFHLEKSEIETLKQECDLYSTQAKCLLQKNIPLKY